VPEPLEFVGLWLAQRLTGHHNNSIGRYVGSPDAYCRSGCRDNPLWLAERIYSYTRDRRSSPGPSNAPTFYSGVEGARFVGITVRALQKILGDRPSCALLLPASYVRTDPFALWSERLLFAIRKLIASGEIEVHQSSLTKPKYGVRVTSPRHVLAVDQNRETETLRKANPLDFVIW
jgi:hypothetical protein